MPEEEEEPEAEGEEVEGEGEDGEPKPPSLPIPGAEDQFEQLNELLRNNQVCCARLPRGAVDVALQTIGPRAWLDRCTALTHRRPQPHPDH